MTNRENFHMVMTGDKNTTAAPCLEWATWWDKSLRHWENEGLATGLSCTELFDYFGHDHIHQFWFPHTTTDCPKPLTHGAGIIKNMEDYRRIKPYLYPKDAVDRMKHKMEEILLQHNTGKTIVWFTIDGFFWFPRTLLGIENHLYSFYDQPELYHEICKDLLEWQITMIDIFSQYIKADFMTIAEDMSYNNGPMLSEEMYNEFIKPYYEALIPEIKKHGTRVFVDSDGDILPVVPWLVKSGVEGILPLEHQAGVDLQKIRDDYPEFLLLGGFDKMCLFHGKSSIEKEFERILPIIRSGRYIPAMDHQTPPGVPLDDYKYYVKLLRQYNMQACNDLK